MKKTTQEATMLMPEILTVERLTELLDYDPESGVFRWKTDRAWTKAGQRAGGKSQSGYIIISIDGNKYYAQRLAWMFVHGELPNDFIDNINGDPTDNRIANLCVNSNRVRRRDGLADLRSEVAELRAELAELRAEMRAEVADLRGRLGG